MEYFWLIRDLHIMPSASDIRILLHDFPLWCTEWFGVFFFLGKQASLGLVLIGMPITLQLMVNSVIPSDNQMIIMLH